MAPNERKRLPGRRSAGGFSMVEVIISTAVLAISMLGALNARVVEEPPAGDGGDGGRAGAPADRDGRDPLVRRRDDLGW
ncbi:MAG: prepilin-type N-terminal cleavage/methylation domain-containing protein [bacterium]|nr:prepilin-type N-terminal cleavage/methylation domain-containing protein [bacterium]